MATRPTPPADSPLLTPDQAAARINAVLNVDWNGRTIVRRVKAGDIAGERVDGRGTVRISQAALDEYLATYVERHRVVPKTQAA